MNEWKTAVKKFRGDHNHNRPRRPVREEHQKSVYEIRGRFQRRKRQRFTEQFSAILAQTENGGEEGRSSCCHDEFKTKEVSPTSDGSEFGKLGEWRFWRFGRLRRRSSRDRAAKSEWFEATQRQNGSIRLRITFISPSVRCPRPESHCPPSKALSRAVRWFLEKGKLREKGRSMHHSWPELEIISFHKQFVWFVQWQ